MLNIQPKDTLLFIGDSITDCGRRDFFQANLGQGYVNMIAGDLYRKFFHYHLNIINRGVSGNTMADLVERWQSDCLDYQPNIVTIQIGINDIWHRHSAGTHLTPDGLAQFIDHYRYLIQSIKAQNAATHIILVEPFLLPEPESNQAMLTDLLAMNQAISQLAENEAVLLVKTHTIMNRLAKGLGCTTVSGQDGVHPTSFGHAHLAERWFVTTRV